MSILFLDSFDHYGLLDLKWDAVAGTNPAMNSPTIGRFTPGAFHITGFTENQAGSGTITKDLITTATEGIFGFAFFLTESANNTNFRFLDSGGVFLGGIHIVGTTVELSDTTGVVATAASAVTVNVWQYLEVRVKSHATLGEVELHVGGELVESATGVDTGGNALGKFSVTHDSETDDSWMDDLYVLDNLGSAPQNTFIGDTRITVLRPSANGTNNNFVPNGADTNWEATDETLEDGDTTFVESGQVSAKDDYDNKSFSDVGVTPGTIFGVQTVNSAKKTDAGQLRYLDQMIVGGVTFDNGTEVTATSGNYKMTTFVRDTDPSDDGTWTESKVDAVGSGFEITFREV